MLDFIPAVVRSASALVDERRGRPDGIAADSQLRARGDTEARTAHPAAKTVARPEAQKEAWLDRSLRSAKPTVTVVIPTLNESRNLPYAMWRLPECVTEVIVVDGRSSDDTALSAALMRRDVRVVLEPTEGKGAALKRGFSEATGDVIIMLDADGSADGGEIQRFVDVLLAGADFAKGSRFLPGGGSGDLTRIRALGNQTLTGLVNLVCQTRFSDLCYGYNAFWRDCLEFIEVDVSGFEVETRLMMTAATSGLAMVEVPSWEYSRVHGVSNLKAVRDGWRVLRAIGATTMEVRRGRASVRCRPLESPSRGNT
jgi:Glycosyl transferase family 2